MKGPFTPAMLNVFAAEWEAAADAEVSREPNSEAAANAASLYRRTAESFRIEARTGKATCVCHLKPVEECRA